MKITYLVKKKQEDGSTQLTVVSHQEWRAVADANKGLPKTLQRYFVREYLFDGDVEDCIYIGVSPEQYHEWHREHMASKRNQDFGKYYWHLSLASIVGVEDTRADFADIDVVVGSASETHRSQKALEMLRNSLAEWKP